MRLNDKNAVSIPEPIVQLQRQLDQFRSAQPHRVKIPESLWQAAEESAREHGLYAVVHPLRLDYVRLKRRLEGASKHAEKKHVASPGFVELIVAQPGGVRDRVRVPRRKEDADSVEGIRST